MPLMRSHLLFSMYAVMVAFLDYHYECSGTGGVQVRRTKAFNGVEQKCKLCSITHIVNLSLYCKRSQTYGYLLVYALYHNNLVENMNISKTS